MPNRIIKESICTSDSIDSLDWFSEVLFYRLIVNCDDYGRFDGRTAVIKNRLFPLKDSLTLKNVETAINKLVSVGLVCRYEANGKPFLLLPTWNEHQIVRAKKSKFPEPEPDSICKQMYSDDCKCSRNPIQYENENDIVPPIAPQGADKAAEDDDFEAFWTAYPRHVAKDKARTAFGRVPKSEHAVLMAALEQHKRSEQWTKDGGQYIPHPATWLNQRRWDGDAPPAAKTGRKVEYAQHEVGDLSHLCVDLNEED